MSKFTIYNCVIKWFISFTKVVESSGTVFSWFQNKGKSKYQTKLFQISFRLKAKEKETQREIEKEKYMMSEIEDMSVVYLIVYFEVK